MTLFVLLLLLALPQDQITPAAEPTLKFAWPETMTATVESERRKEQKPGKEAPPKVSEVKVRYRMKVSPHPVGRLIAYDDYAILGQATDAQTGEQVQQVLSTMVPSVTVTNAGGFAGIANVETLRAAMNDMLSPLKKEASKAPAGAQEFIAALTSDQFLNSLAAQEWQAMVQAWVGLPIGPEVTEFESEQPFPLFPDTKVTLKGNARMVSKQECVRGGTTVPCATFEMTSATDPKAIDALMKRMFRGEKGFEGVVFERFEITSVVRVTMETTTMVPHNWSLDRSVAFSATHPKEGRTEVTQRETRSTKYSYPVVR